VNTGFWFFWAWHWYAHLFYACFSAFIHNKKQ